MYRSTLKCHYGACDLYYLITLVRFGFLSQKKKMEKKYGYTQYHNPKIFKIIYQNMKWFKIIQWFTDSVRFFRWTKWQISCRCEYIFLDSFISYNLVLMLLSFFWVAINFPLQVYNTKQHISSFQEPFILIQYLWYMRHLYYKNVSNFRSVRFISE